MTNIDIKAELKELESLLTAARQKLEGLKRQNKRTEAEAQLREIQGIELTIEILSGPNAEEVLGNIQESEEDVAAGKTLTHEELLKHLGLPPQPRK